MMETTVETPKETAVIVPPEQAGWWQQFWWRYSPHGELPMSSIASWILHGLVCLLAWFAAIGLIGNRLSPPHVDVVSFGSGDGPVGGGDGSQAGEPGDVVASVEVGQLSRD